MDRVDKERSEGTHGVGVRGRSGYTGEAEAGGSRRAELLRSVAGCGVIGGAAPHPYAILREPLKYLVLLWVCCEVRGGIFGTFVGVLPALARFVQPVRNSDFQ